MSETADSVVVELEAKLGNYQRDVAQGANAFQTSMKQMQASASQTEQHVGRAMGNTRLAHLELLHVVTATSDSYAAGIPITRAFTMEIGRIAEAAQLAGPALGKVGAILSGPWGIALQVGIGLLAALVASHQKAADASKDHRDSEEKLSDAIQGRKTSTEELLKASQDLEAQERKALQTSALQIEHEYTLADATMKTAIAKREKLKADLEQARHDEQAAMDALQHPAAGTRAEAGDIGRVQAVSAAQGRIADLDKQIGEQTDLIATNAKSAAEAMARFARATETHVGRANALFDHRRKDLETGFTARATAALASGDTAGAARINTEEQAALHGLNVERERAVEVARKLDEAERGKADHEDKRAAQLTNFEPPVAAGFSHLSSGFGEHRGAGDTGRAHAHGGVDIPVPVGTRVSASAAGVVIESGTMPGFGNVVVVDHGAGTVSIYGHLSQILAQKGAQVAAGQEIGLSGGARGAPGAGDSHGPHLHYEIRQGGMRGTPVDPTKAQYHADPLAVGVDAEKLAQQAAAAQDKAAARQEAADTELARAKDALIVADRALATTAEQKAALAKQDIEADRAAYEKHITDEHDRKKLTDAEFATLKGLNDARAKSRTDLVNEQEEERKRKVAEQQAKLDTNVALGSLQAQEDLLQTQEKLAETAKDRRDIELRLLDLQFKEEKIRLEAIIAESDRLNSIQNATEAEKQAAREAAAAAQTARGQLATLPQRQANAAESVARQTEGPMAAYRRQLMNATSDMDVALQSVEVHAFQGLEDGLTSTITKVLGLKGAFGQMAASIIADLARIEIERAILGSTSGSGGGGLFGTIANLLGAAGSVTGTTTGDFNGIPTQTFNFGGHRASGGPVVAGTLYRVNEMGIEGFKPAGSGTIVPLGEMPPVSPQGGTTVLQPIHFDLRGAVMTEDILAQMNALAEQAAMRGAIGGMALTQREAARAASRRLA